MVPTNTAALSLVRCVAIEPAMTLPEITNDMDDTWVLDGDQWWRFETP